MEERIKDSLEEIKKELAAVEATIQQLPEIQAATLLLMYDEYQAAQMRGQKASDLWAIQKPHSNHENP